MSRARSTLMVIGACLIVAASTAAQDTAPIRTKLQDWDQLSEKAQGELLRAIKDARALDADDTIIYVGAPQIRMMESNKSLSVKPKASDLAQDMDTSLWRDFCEHLVKDKFAPVLAKCAGPGDTSGACKMAAADQEARIRLCGRL